MSISGGALDELEQVMSGKQVAFYEPVLLISNEQGDSLVLERAAGGDGVLLAITGPGSSGSNKMFWLKSDRIGLLISVLKKFQ